MATPSATLEGIEIEGKARDSRAKLPSVEDARSSKSADLIRDRVDRRKGRDPDWGVPRSERRWEVKVRSGCFNVETETCVVS